MATLPHDDLYQLVREPIDIAALARHVRAPEDGATITFDGFVRNQSHNRPTLYLDYEAYESMALAKMREIGVQLHEKYSIHRVAMVHRLGRLEIGETTVFITVSVPHERFTRRSCPARPYPRQRQSRQCSRQRPRRKEPARSGPYQGGFPAI